MPGALSPGMLAVLRCKFPPLAFRDLILQAKRFTAVNALESGLIDAISESDRVLQDAIELGKKWAPKVKEEVNKIK